MIKLTKGEIPCWLAENRELKTAEYLSAPVGNRPTPWRAVEVVAALKRECGRKCMYCECVVDDASYSAVEHIRPKSLFEELVLDWQNLGLVCPRCNTNKGDYWTETESLQLLNPYKDSVEDHIEFRGPLTVAKIESTRGQTTVAKLKFHTREDLLISRMNRIEDLESKLLLWHNAVDPELKELFAEGVRSAIARDREFSGPLKKYAMDSGFPVEAD